MQHLTIDELMMACGVASFPDRWRGFYEEEMARFEKEGCPMIDPAYYEALEETYGVIGDNLPVYQETALLLREDDALSRFFVLLLRALRERDTVMQDIQALTLPKDEANSLKYRMLPALAMAQGVPYASSLMEKRGIPEEIRRKALCSLVSGVKSYRNRHNGEYGYANFDWNQRAYDALLYPIGSLSVDLIFPTFDFFRVYENEKGEIVSFADGLPVHKSGYPLGSFRCEDEEDSFVAVFTETEDSLIGHPYDKTGHVCRETVTLKKSEWRARILPNDPMIILHIPKGVPFTPEAIDQTVADIRVFLAKYFPECQYKAFFTGSWLIDPQLEALLGPDSNIVRFGKRFTPVPMKDAGYMVFSFAFHKAGRDFKFEDLPEETRLQRAIKKHYLEGKAIYGTTGFFF